MVVKYAGMAIGIGLLVAALTFAVAAFVVDPTNYVLLVPAGLFLLVGLIALSAGIELAGAAISEPRFAKHGTGLAATATVLAVRDTNMTVTTSVAGPDAPVYEFHLRVARDSAEPYEVQHTQSVPRLGLGAVLPGSAFDVLVDPTDHASLFIDWPATLGVGVVPVQSVPRGRKRRLRVPELASELLVTGAPATATVGSFRSLGTVGGLGITPTDPADPAILGHAVYVFKLRVEQEGRRAYKARLGQRVPPEVVPTLRKGLRVAAAVDPQERRKIALDWSTLTPD